MIHVKDSQAGIPLRVLLLEDSSLDAELLLTELRRSGFQPAWKQVSTAADFQLSLTSQWELILADFALPGFDALEALRMLRASGSSTPLIVVTGAVGEEVAAECIKEGAADYLLKDRLTRLGSAAKRALEHRRAEEENRQALSAIRESEQRLQALVQHSSGGILLLNASGQVTGRYNDLFPAADNWYPENFLEWMVPEDRPGVREMWDHLGDPIESVQFRISNGQGVPRRLEAICNDLREMPCVGAIIVHYRDVTSRHHLEEQVRNVHKMQAIGQLAAGVGHDFNNLLTIIRGQGELLVRRPDLPASAHGRVREILGACEGAAVLTQNLLAFSRKPASQPENLDLNRAVSQLEPLLRSLLEKEFVLRLDIENDLGLVQLDRSGLQQILMNLVVNARDSMPGYGVVSLEVRRIDGALQLSVSDHGCGMDEQTRNRIFEPFFTTKDVGKGTGLGLSTVYAIVTNASGTISVESEPGKGSTFRVNLPSSSPRPQPSGASKPAPDGRTILVVDDEDRILDLIVSILQPLHYYILTARSAEEAMEQWKAAGGRVDLLLTDVRMPRIKGPELANLLVRERPDLRVLFMSGGDRSELGNGPAAPLLSKPFTADALAQAIRESLDAPFDQTRVLVVDDNAQIRSLLRSVLEAEGYSVEAAADGNQALVLFMDSPPDIVVTDIVMPETDGIALIRKIRKLAGAVKIIAMSGALRQHSYLEAASTLGADVILDKPLNMDSFRETIRQLSNVARVVPTPVPVVDAIGRLPRLIL